MTSLSATVSELQQLSVLDLQQLIVEQGWNSIDTQDREELVAYIQERTRTRSRLPVGISAGVVSAPSSTLADELLDFYQVRGNLVRQLQSMNDASLLAVVEKIGRDWELSPPYVRIGAMQMQDRDALIWYLVSSVF